MKIKHNPLNFLAFALVGALAVITGCNQDRAADPEQPSNESWSVAPRIFAGDLTEDELSKAVWVRAVATREGDVIAVAETTFIERKLELTIPNAGSVLVTVSGYSDKNRTLLLWSGAAKVETGATKPLITIIKGPGLLAVPTPRFSASSGTFRKATKVAILADSSNLELHYTTDGGDPSSSSPKYLDSILVDRSMVLSAIATRTGRAPSLIAVARYELKQDTVAAPKFSIDSGSYDKVLSVAITSDTTGAEIRYTTDGSDPIATSIKYTEPVEVASTKTLRAIAFKKDLAPSSIASAAYRISLKKVKTPVFTPEPGAFDSAQTVVIASDSGAEIRYTVDGSEPTASSLLYAGGVRVEQTATIKAIATMKGRIESSMMTGKYSIAGTIAPPEFKPVGGIYKAALKVTLVADSGASIRYTMDTTAPLANWSVYAGPIDVAASQVIKAYASRGGKNSAPARAAYSVRPDTLPAPVFDTAAGTYAVGQKVTLSCDSAGAEIRYTLDGSEPGATSTKYGDAIVLQATTTIRAYALKTGLVSSEKVSAKYEIAARDAMAAPKFYPEGGEFDTAQDVTITSDSSAATIHYTTDGSEPTDKSAKYTGPITVASSMLLRAIALKAGSPSSVIKDASFTITEAGRVETPRIVPAGGSFDVEKTVVVYSNTDGASIRYTLDGTEPTSSSTLYEDPFLLSESKVVKAIAFKDGLKASAVATANFTITIKAPDTAQAPEISPNGGSFTGSRKVGISSSQDGAIIYYTIDGTLPSDRSMIYTDSIELDSSATVRAIAGGSGLVASKVVEAKFTITRVDTVAAPTFDQDSGTYKTALKVKLTSATEGATVYYTLDGRTPTGASSKYVAALEVDSSMTIKAMALKDGMAGSAVTVHAYRILKKVAQPVFSAVSGTYTPPKSVTLSCATSGAVIYYTLDGTDPTTASNKYDREISLSTSSTLRAIAVADGMVESDIAMAEYVIQEIGSAASPVFSPFGGSFLSSINVSITSATVGADIYYTLDGTLPNTSSSKYTAAITISSSKTLRAMAVASGLNNSSVTTATYTYLQPVATPVFTPTPGSFTTTQSVGITTTTPGATIYYTVDGSTPSAAAKLYGGPILVSQSTTIKAVAVAGGMANSAIATGAYTILLPVAVPTFSIKDGTYSAVQSVTIRSTTTSASIYYTTDGTTPTEKSNLYSTPLSISSTQVVKAIAVKSGMSNSPVSSASYVIDFPNLAAPTITPATGTYNAAQTVTITSPTSGAKIYFTADGTTPTTASTLYSVPFTRGTTTTVKAIATMAGWDNSAVGSSTITMQCSPVTFSLLGTSDTTYISTQSLTLKSPTTGASIYYTIDGTTPSATNGKKYSAAISVSYSQTVRAVAVKTDWANSSVSVLGISVVPKYNTSGAPAKVTFSPASGTFTVGQKVELACTTADAVIHYTTDWSEPTDASPIFTPGKTIAVSATTTIKARAYNAKGASFVAGASYIIR